MTAHKKQSSFALHVVNLENILEHTFTAPLQEHDLSKHENAENKKIMTEQIERCEVTLGERKIHHYLHPYEL